MSINTSLYSINKIDFVDGSSHLEVVRGKKVIAVAQDYTEAYDAMQVDFDKIEDNSKIGKSITAKLGKASLEIKRLEAEAIKSTKDIGALTTENAELLEQLERFTTNTASAKVNDLAETNAKLRKQLGEKHDDNCRLQRQLAEQHNKLREAYAQCVYGTCHDDLEESTLSAQVRMSNAEVKVDDLTEENAILRRQVDTALKELKDLEMLEDSAASRAIIKDLERLTAKVNTLWEERYDS
jgi:hypothetical protein